MKVLESKTRNEAKKIKVAEVFFLVQQEINQSMKEHQRLLLFISNTSNPDVDEYMHIMQKRVLKRLKTTKATENTEKISPAISFSI